MNIAMLIAILLQSGACSQSQFQSPMGGNLDVVICPIMHAPPAPSDQQPDEPALPAPQAAGEGRT